MDSWGREEMGREKNPNAGECIVLRELSSVFVLYLLREEIHPRSRSGINVSFGSIELCLTRTDRERRIESLSHLPEQPL